MDALGLDSMPEVGSTRMMMARVSVTTVSTNEVDGGKKRKSMSLQITDLGLGPDDESDHEKMADKLYGKKA
jgi:hypothetical protein